MTSPHRSEIRQWTSRDRVGARLDSAPADEDPHDFNSAGALVRWWLNEGLLAISQARAIDYSRDGHGTGRDFTTLARLHAKYAAVVASTKRLTPAQVELLTLAYQAGKSDLQIAERRGLGRSAITRQRNAALRVVEAHARQLGGLLPAECVTPEYPRSTPGGWKRPPETEELP